jgi:ABC-type amino acid transport substrate-binding protein
MKKLAIPVDTMDISYKACLDGIIDDNAKKKYEGSRLHLLALANNYIELTTNEKIVLLTPHEHSKKVNPKIVGEITRDELLYLYNYYMVKRKPGRNIYDRIMAAAKEECPFCGGIGHAKNLDHYLPK